MERRDLIVRTAALAAAGTAAIYVVWRMRRRPLTSSGAAPLLTSHTVAEYVSDQLRSMQDLPLDPDAALVAREIGDGNLNYAWCVAEEADSSRAIFVKQAPPFIKCLGDKFGLSAERLLIESEVLAEYTAVAPGLVPRIYSRDAERCAMITEFLHGHELMRTALRAGRCPPSAARHVARFMAMTHARTHARASGASGGARWAHLVNESMCAITADFVFSKPLDAADVTNRCSDEAAAAAAALRADTELVAAVERLRTIFLTRKECLVHGDLHTGSVMVPAAGGDGPARVIDAEFAHFGCAAFDVGCFVANLLFARASAESAAGKAALEQMMREVWQTYVATLREAQPRILADPASLEELCDLVAGFCGVELIRRTIGAAHVDDIESIPSPARRGVAERACLFVGELLVREGGKGLRGGRLLAQEFEAIVAISTIGIDGQA